MFEEDRADGQRLEYSAAARDDAVLQHKSRSPCRWYGHSLHSGSFVCHTSANSELDIDMDNLADLDVVSYLDNGVR